jgi:branched-chain amino acid aminotransferase
MLPYQRAIFYGDAIFETLRVVHGRAPLLERHIVRLKKGLYTLGFEVPDNWDVPFFEAEIAKISPLNARVRLTVYRSEGGLYFPENNTPQCLCTATKLPSPLLEWATIPLQIGVCERVRLPIDDFSGVKTLNAPRYVQAAIEARKAGWDDGLVLNSANRVCEATSSNVFWWKNGALHTILLTEGCVAGVMRELLIELAQKADIEVLELAVTPKDISTADELFLTNAVRGIVPVGQLAGKIFQTNRTMQLFNILQKYFITVE